MFGKSKVKEKKVGAGGLLSKKEKVDKLQKDAAAKTQKEKDRKYLEFAKRFSRLSLCERHQVGCVIVKDDKLLVAGCNASLRGVPSCAELGGCVRNKRKIASGTQIEICTGLCAEQSAIYKATRENINLEGATMYVTMKPCTNCARVIINFGFKRVVYLGDYPDGFSDELFKLADIKVEKFKE